MNKRRDFIKKTSTGLLAGSLLSPFHNTSAKSYSKIIGANNRIIIAFQGLGRRFPGLCDG
jgi:hypothetical protein